MPIVQQLREIDCPHLPALGSETLLEILASCATLKKKRHKAFIFVAVYGPWFRRFTLSNKWHEVLVLVYMALIALVVGLCQPYPQLQVTTAAALSVSMLVYTLWRRPFNEFVRGIVEAVSFLLFTAGVCLLSVAHFVEFNFNVGLAMLCLNLASLAVKVLYYIGHVVPFYKRLWSRKCRSHRILVEPASGVE